MTERPPTIAASPSGDSSDAKPPRRRWRRIALEALLLLGVYFAVTAWRERDALPTDGQAPAFALTALDGSTVRLTDFAGKTVLLHFWATWCGVCKAELPMMRAIHEHLGTDEVLLAIVASDDRDEVARFATEHELRYPILFADRRLLAAYGVSAFPTNYVVTGDGRVASSTVGLSSRLGLWWRMSCAGH
jgi:peroxiredoxin